MTVVDDRQKFANAERFPTAESIIVDDIPAFDLLIGSAEARERILAGDDPRAIADAVSLIGEEERAVVVEAKAAAHPSSKRTAAS